jgi:hypothetical protein
MRHAYVKRVVATVTGKPIENVRKREPLFWSVAFNVQVLIMMLPISPARWGPCTRRPKRRSDPDLHPRDLGNRHITVSSGVSR